MTHGLKAQNPDETQERLTAARKDLKEAAFRGIRWTALAQLATEVLTILSSVPLARLVPPAEFGRVAVAGIAFALGGAIIGQGVATPVVQFRRIDRRHLEAATALSIAAGALLTTVAILVAPLVVSPLFGHRVSFLVQIAAPVFILSGLGTVSYAVVSRRLDFPTMSKISIASLVSGALASVLLAAFAGLDAEALIAGLLIRQAVSTLLYLRATGMVVPRWRRGATTEIAAFGIPAGLASIVYAAFRNVDYAILGARLNPAQVGFYWRAFQLGVEYQGKMTTVIRGVSFPVYSRSENLDDMRAMRTRIVRLQATAVLPLLALLSAIAPVLVPWLYGSRWESTVVPTQILALGGMTVALATGTGPLLMAAGRPRALLAFNACALSAFGGTVYALAPYGIRAVCVGVVSYQFVALGVQYYVLEHRVAGVQVPQILKDIVPAFAGSAGLAAVAFPLTQVLANVGISDPLVLVIVTAVACSIYVLILRSFFRAAWVDLTLVLRRVLRRRPTRPDAVPAPAPASATTDPITG
ncbi:MAG TPA: oligosaccharide flippase family protein [Gaiellaceae bacterium]|jgi:PST family polysaccharide transporter/lipopolysaccharide exporter|nr:oligosaccharide flippase family protein [Gaiellaceae bacterium]